MLLRKPSDESSRHRESPFPQIPLASGAPARTAPAPPGGATSVDASHEAAAAAAGGPQGLRSADSDSDWDASDREDSTKPTRRQGHGVDQSPIEPPSADVPGSGRGVTQELEDWTQGLRLDVGAPASAAAPASPSARSNTNPFRRYPSQDQQSVPAELATNTPSGLAANNPFKQKQKQDAGLLIDHEPLGVMAEASGQKELLESSASVWATEQHPSGPLDAGADSGKVQEPAVRRKAVPRSSLPAASSGSPGSSKISPPTGRSEVYQIRNIFWKDATAPKSLRESPVLIQNANGPCPLLALVNALVLATPPEVETELVETLRTRENVSLGLLLDAVFDELMSGRRGSTASELPDVQQLYAFLLALHTGMNVNPRFTPQAGSVLGAFEETDEMRLYGVFDLPLIHGWLPARNEPAFAAFARSAPSYDEAQSLLFREDELERVLQKGQLQAHDENAFMDLSIIKQFLSTWPTQLTEHGLATMSDAIRSCQVAILFRNDHFSTVYKEPSTNRLMSLVTDVGYAPHADIVWESLTDVSGSGSQFFSGDFQPISTANSSHRTTTAPKASPGAAAHRSEASAGQRPQTVPDALSGGHYDARVHSRSEQEDHDLALAIQLQEEEEERQRRQEAAHRREERLSQQYLSEGANQSGQQRPAIPPRRSQQNTTPAQPAAGDSDSAPPTYEEARRDRPYNPLAESSSASDSYAYSSHSRRGARRARQSQGGAGAGAVSLGAAPTGQQQAQFLTTHEAVSDRREGCTVM